MKRNYQTESPHDHSNTEFSVSGFYWPVLSYVKDVLIFLNGYRSL